MAEVKDKRLFPSCHSMISIVKYTFLLGLLSISCFGQTVSQKLTYDIPIEDLSKVKIITKEQEKNISHDYDLTLEDLSKLAVVKEIKVEKKVNVNYDLDLEELMQMEVHLVKNEVSPTLDMPLKGLLKLDVTKEYHIVDNVEIAYDLSLDGLMKLSLVAKE